MAKALHRKQTESEYYKTRSQKKARTVYAEDDVKFCAQGEVKDSFRLEDSLRASDQSAVAL